MGYLPERVTLGSAGVWPRRARRSVLRQPFKWQGRWQGLILPLALLLVWEGVVAAGWVSAYLLPPPSEIGGTLLDLARSGELQRHAGVSCLRVLCGFSIGASLALVLGALVGLSRRAEVLLDPSFQALRAIPSLAWVPLLLLWLGIDEAPKITLIAIGAFFPVYLNFVAGIQNVDRVIVMASAPGRITGEVAVGLARPRARRHPQLAQREAEVLTMLDGAALDYLDLTDELAARAWPFAPSHAEMYAFAL